MDPTNYLALQVKPLDVATPLLMATRIRQQQAETQQAETTMKQQAAGQFARGVAVYADKPEFGQKWAEGMDQLHSQGMIDTPQYQKLRDNPSPLMLKQIIAQTTPPAQALQERQIAEGERHNRAAEGISSATLAETRRQHDIAEGKPVSVSAGSSLVEPKTGKVVYQGSNGLSAAGEEIAARQIINGDMSALQNIGRGAQGDAKLTAIKNKAAEILTSENGMSAADAAAHLGKQLQSFKASGVGQSTEARTTATREANLNLILKATEAAIPAAIEASEKVARTGWVPLNKIIQGGEVIASNPELKRFGMANLQLAEHWARAMNPTGVMRESDRDMALRFLMTADSKDTYRQVVDQVRTQITRERDAVRGGGTAAPNSAAAPAAAPGAPSATTASGVPAPPPGFTLVK